MARPRGQVVVHYDIDAVADASGRAFDKAAKQVATEIEAYMKAKTARPYPPVSRPEQYPRARTYELNSGIHVTGTRNGITVFNEAVHGVILQRKYDDGTPGGRDWADRALRARDWMGRIAKLAREFTGGNSKPPARRKKR